MYDPLAVSEAGVSGLGQLMLRTARHQGLRTASAKELSCLTELPVERSYATLLRATRDAVRTGTIPYEVASFVHEPFDVDKIFLHHTHTSKKQGLVAYQTAQRLCATTQVHHLRAQEVARARILTGFLVRLSRFKKYLLLHYNMIVLGIESTAHTFGVGIVRMRSEEQPDVLANVRRIYTTESGGLIPAKLSEHHMNVFFDVLSEAMNVAGVSSQDVSVVSYARAPGIGHSLRIGAGVARSLALRWDVPIVGVNHAVAHLEVGRVFSGEDDVALLYASGANTQVLAREQGAYRVFGETLDLGVGNFLDTIARLLRLGFPGGPHLERLAAQWEGELLMLPYAVKGMDVSFTGLQTAIAQRIDAGVDAEQLAFSVQETVFAMLVEVSERALAHTGKECLVIGGGVACNARLQEMCRTMCKERGARFFAPEKQFLVDNGAMIALLAGRVFTERGGLAVSSADINPYERVESVPQKTA